MHKKLSEEEIALRIVGIYFEQVARRGVKRQIDFDSMINAYFYVLQKLNNKDELLASMKSKVVLEEKKLLNQSKTDLFPTVESLKQKVPEKTTSPAA